MACIAASRSAVGLYDIPYLPILTNLENNPRIQTVIWIATTI